MSIQIDNGTPGPGDELLAPVVRGYFTNEEVVTLNKWLPRFHQTKRTNGKKFLGFWEPCEREFFDEHPRKDLTEEEIAKGMTPGKRIARARAVSRRVMSCVS